MTGYTVEQLIKELQKYPPHAWVMLHEKGSEYDVNCTTIEYDDGVEPDLILSNEKTNWYDEKGG